MGSLSAMVNSDSSFLQSISREIARPILIAFTESGVAVFRAASLVTFIALVLSFFVREIPLRMQSGVAAKAEAEAAGQDTAIASMH